MHYLFVIHSLRPETGGPRENVLAVARGLIAGGDKVTVVSLDSPGDIWQQEIEIPTEFLGPSLGSYGYSRKLRPWLKSNLQNYDITIVRGLWRYVSYAIYLENRRQKNQYMIMPQGALDNWSVAHTSMKRLKKIVYWTMFEKRICQSASGVIFTDELELDACYTSFRRDINIPIIVPNGVAAGPIVKQPLKQKLFHLVGDIQDKKVFLFVGRLHLKKGIDLLIGAFAKLIDKHHSYRLIVVGPDGGVKKDLIQLVEELGIGEKVRFTGPLYGALKWALYDLADLLLLPSYQENFGIVVGEALSRGTPVLISKGVNSWKRVERWNAGIFVEPDVEHLLIGMQQWNHMNQDEQREMGKQAVLCFQNEFSIERTIDTLRRVVHKTVLTNG